VTQKCLRYAANAFVDFIVFYDEWHLHIERLKKKNKKKEKKVFQSVWIAIIVSIHQTALSFAICTFRLFA
jgi:hypothetical protein